MPTMPPPVGTLAGLLVGLWLLLVLGGGIVVLTGHLLTRVVRTRWDRRHPQKAAAREQTHQARRLAAEWPLLAQTLGLGYRDQWTRQHRFPAAEFAADHQGVTATVAAIAGAGLADYQRAASYLADTWGCVTVRAEQQGPGLIRLRGLRRDPLLAPAHVDLSGIEPASLTSWWLGWAEDSRRVEHADRQTGEVRQVYDSGREPDGVLLKACGTRRESRCPSCAATYRADAYQLLAAGLKGGKGVPETIDQHPRLFVTFTAPSFGRVHTRKAQGRLVLPCHPHRQGARCPHGT